METNLERCEQFIANKMRTIVVVSVCMCEFIQVVIQDEVRTGMSMWEDKAIDQAIEST